MLALGKYLKLCVAASKMCHIVARSGKWKTDVKITLIHDNCLDIVYRRSGASSAGNDLESKQNIPIS